MEQLKPKQIKAIHLLIYGSHTQRKVAEELNVTETTVWRWFQDEEFCKVLEEEQRKYLAPLATQAISKLQELLHDDNVTPSVKFQVAKDLADRGGYKPTDKIEQTGAPQIVINPVCADGQN